MVFRSRFNRGIAIGVWALSVVIVVSLALAPEVENLVLVALPALASYAAWLVFWHPAVVVDDAEVSIVNATYSVSVPWGAVIQVDTRYALTVRTPRRKYSATAAPAPGSMGTYSANRDVRLGTNERRNAPADIRRPSDLPRTDSGAAAALVLGRWNELTEAGDVPMGEADTILETVKVNTLPLVVAALLLAAAVASLTTLA